MVLSGSFAAATHADSAATGLRSACRRHLRKEAAAALVRPGLAAPPKLANPSAARSQASCIAGVGPADLGQQAPAFVGRKLQQCVGANGSPESPQPGARRDVLDLAARRPSRSTVPFESCIGRFDLIANCSPHPCRRTVFHAPSLDSVGIQRSNGEINGEVAREGERERGTARGRGRRNGSSPFFRS